MGAERERVAGFGRLEDGLRQAGDWYRWGPYVSERQWGTVREDYSADGEAWDYLPHDHARSRAYRWGEDGLAGFCDIEQRLCLGLALWNGRDPILKERAFGLTGAQGNHGEDVKEYWWYLDAVPSHAWNRWRYHYPQAAFPYQDLIDRERPARQVRARIRAARHRRVRRATATGSSRCDYAKADPDDLLMTVRVTNAGPGRRHPARAADRVVPQHLVLGRSTRRKPELAATGDDVGRRSTTRSSAQLELLAGAGPGRRGADAAVLRERDQRRSGCSAPSRSTPYPKDGINDHVIHGAPTVNPDQHGHQVRLLVPADRRRRARRSSCGCGCARPAREPAEAGDAALGADFDRVVAQRRAEADEFYAELTPSGASADEAMVMRQAFAGMLWSKQLYYYDVARWLDGDPTQPTPPNQPAERTQRPLAELQRVRHHVDAGQVGVPVVRRVGPRVPLRGAGARRPGVRQVPADPAVPGVVPASERGAARLRVGLRRRQPAGAGVGRAGGVRHRRRPRHRLPQPGLRQAAGQLHLVGQPGGRRRATTCSRAASSVWTTSARSTARTCRSAARSSSPTPPAGWRSTRSPWGASPSS